MQEKITFNKKPITYTEQIELLKSRGMTFNDETKSKHLLEFISYYRLSGYWFHLYDNLENKQFLNEVSFDYVFMLYCFDKELRKLLLNEIEKIEVAIRAKISYYFAHKENGYWYLNQENFQNNDEYQKTLKMINEDLKRSKELFIISFKNKYKEEMPPTWILLEIISFGNLSYLFSNINTKYQEEIANEFLLHKKVMKNWMHTIIYIRNICAHHSRLYNIELRIKPVKNLKKMNIMPMDNTNIYSAICVIKYFLNTINPNSSFKTKLNSLFENYPSINTRDMGFETNWLTSELWI